MIGIGEKEMFAASDVAALVRYTRQVVHLEDGELAVLRADGFHTFASDARETAKEPLTVDWDAGHYDTGGYEHYLLKEISEQPDTVDPHAARPARRALPHRPPGRAEHGRPRDPRPSAG